ncbi:hypothetical protein PCASD_11549 [Puccinia coronata f. sp. avenae]|uniref:Uncharacterized protein n=1 Tax=Puccinia coronata f. sp. avenae TaxID=200324 RepID=A0A2N5ULU4_9BASI|nr:hypothetical protein PCASD_11549 [Puccinia coronata f. sp. avenae]
MVMPSDKITSTGQLVVLRPQPANLWYSDLNRPTCGTQTSTGQLVVLNKPQTSQLVVLRLQPANLWDSVIKF